MTREKMTKNKLVKRIIFLWIAVLGAVNMTAQSQTIRGRVSDELSKEPLIGVSVFEIGTQNGTTTDADGNFRLSVNPNSLLRISYLGYVTQEVSTAGKSQIDVLMQQDETSLDEVVVVGYGTQRKASLTSAISQISGDEAFKDRGLGNVTVALQGEMPGLVVTRTTTRPGNENAAMKIRGDISVNGNSSPLVLIDGISGSLDELNQMDANDIENISILKDASAAIYGARSASGVLLVTTKRGKKGAAKITYNGLFSRTIDGIAQPFTNNAQWLEMWYEAQYQDARANNPSLTGHGDILNVFNWWIFENNSVLPGIDQSGNLVGRLDLWKALHNGEEMVLQNSATRVHKYEPNHYLMDELYGQGKWQKHSVSVSGADDKFGYMASLGYANNQSQLKIADDGEKKYSARLNMDYQATKVLKLETGMSYEKRDIVNPFRDVGAGWYDPWFWPLYNGQGQFYDSFSGTRNPVAGVVGGGQVKTGFTTSRLNLKATFDLSQYLKGLSISATGGYKSVSRSWQESKNTIRYYDWAGNLQGTNQATAELREEVREWQNITLGGFINYENLFNSVHRVSAMAGMTSEEENYKRLLAGRLSGPLYEGSGLVDLDVMVSGTNNAAEGGQSSWAFLSYLTRLNYAYDDRYLIEFLGRRDGSSRLFPDQRWKNFFSVSGGWVISRENFLKDSSWLNFLKLRYNYGKTGSVEGIGNYERFATMATGSAFFGATLATQPAISLGGMTSSTRTWESIVKHDAGIDFTFMENRLSGAFDYFSNTNDGMFIPVTYPAILGAAAPRTNNGKFRTKGWEFSLDWKDQIEQVTYHVGGYLADASSEVLELENNENIPNPGRNSNRLIGKPREAFYVYETDGIFQTQAEADAYYDQYYWNADRSGPKSGNILPAPGVTGLNRLRPGARKLVDTNGDGAITVDDLVYAGDASPRLTFGFKAGLEWKGFDINAFFQGVGKQVILRTGNVFAPWVTNYTMQHTTAMGKMWSDIAIPNPLNESENLVNVNTATDYTISSRDNNFNRFNYENKDVSVQDLTYVRLKSLVVGYTIPQTLTKKASIDKVRIYFSGDDLWEWTKVKDGYDPEYGEGSNNTFPFSRLISVGLDITF
ncbi:MAG: TonB-dependent receptor [Tannerella sp.]|jgi:TonB-linked SusC/RagA family outer membrane protein|nr:TonB-dependent receptor [Tannerella sp.]